MARWQVTSAAIIYGQHLRRCIVVDWSKAPEGATHCDAEFDDLFCKLIDGDVKVWDSEKWLPPFIRSEETKAQWIKSLIPRPATPDFVRKAVEKEAIRLHQEVMEAAPTEAPRNKYDRTIHGKYGTGKCTVDVYRVLNAFGPLSPEIDHAVKKLLAPGQRGVKDEKQDLLEAIQSIEARLQYLEATE
jgi:hypothetical protein